MSVLESFDFNEVFHSQTTCEDVSAFNQKINQDRCLILHINIRSLNSNYEKLCVFLEGLKVKPYLIVCSESWNLDCVSFLALMNIKFIIMGET